MTQRQGGGGRDGTSQDGGRHERAVANGDNTHTYSRPDWSGAWGGAGPRSACGVAKQALIDDGVDFRLRQDASVPGVIIRIGWRSSIDSFDGRSLTAAAFAKGDAALRAALSAGLHEAGFPSRRILVRLMALRLSSASWS